MAGRCLKRRGSSALTAQILPGQVECICTSANANKNVRSKLQNREKYLWNTGMAQNITLAKGYFFTWIFNFNWQTLRLQYQCFWYWIASQYHHLCPWPYVEICVIHMWSKANCLKLLGVYHQSHTPWKQRIKSPITFTSRWIWSDEKCTGSCRKEEP